MKLGARTFAPLEVDALPTQRAADRPSSYSCKACGEKGHNARSKTCGMTAEERREKARMDAKIRSGLRR